MKQEKLDVARVFERVLDVYRDQFGLFVPAALVIFVPIAIVTGPLVALGPAGVPLGILLGIVATICFHGMVIEAVRDILDGRRDHTIGSLFRSVAPVFGPLVGAGILAGLGIGLGILLLIVPGLILLTIWAVVAPVVVVERPGVFPAFGRSRELVRGHGWQVFGVVVVLILLQIVLEGVVQRLAALATGSFVGLSIADLLVSVFVAPISALATAIVYFELRRLRGEPELAGATQPPGVPQAQPAPAQPPPGPTPPTA